MALAQCTYIGLSDNQIGDAGLSTLAEAVRASLEELRLADNYIGNVGMQVLAGAVSSGVMDRLTVCWRPGDLPPMS